MSRCETVRDLIIALCSSQIPLDAPLATLYDWGAGLKFDVTVHGMHQCDHYCDQYDCPMVGHLMLDIDPRETK